MDTTGLVAFAVAVVAGLFASAIARLPPSSLPIAGDLVPGVISLLVAVTIVAGVFGAYSVVVGAVVHGAPDKRRAHTARSVLRFGAIVVTVIGVLGAISQQWIGVALSLGIAGFAVTFALQQPILSLMGWFYIVAKRPYSVGDRVAIEGTKGDVIDVDYLVTTLWEINGDLVSSHQPSGRVVTFPNSVVLSAGVTNYSWEKFPHVWNEVSIQVAYETDLDYAREEMVAIADDYLGDQMARNVERYREILAETPVELEVSDRPSVNVVQHESWVELRLRYLVHPRRGTRVRNDLYERILDRFDENPDRVAFPVGRNR